MATSCKRLVDGQRCGCGTDGLARGTHCPSEDHGGCGHGANFHTLDQVLDEDVVMKGCEKALKNSVNKQDTPLLTKVNAIGIEDTTKFTGENPLFRIMLQGHEDCPRGNIDVLIAPADTIPASRLSHAIGGFELKTTKRITQEYKKCQREAILQCFALHCSHSFAKEIAPFVVLTDLSTHLEILTLDTVMGQKMICREQFVNVRFGYEAVMKLVAHSMECIQKIREVHEQGADVKFDDFPDAPFRSGRRHSWVPEMTGGAVEEALAKLDDLDICPKDVQVELRRNFYQEIATMFVESRPIPHGIYS